MMSKGLEYYRANKYKINQKRRLKYDLLTNKLTQIQFDIAINRVDDNINIKSINEELLTNIFSQLDECYYNELCLLEKQISKLKNEVLK